MIWELSDILSTASYHQGYSFQKHESNIRFISDVVVKYYTVPMKKSKSFRLEIENHTQQYAISSFSDI